MGIFIAVQSSRVVQGLQVRHIHSLGLVLGTGIRKRMVLSEYVYKGFMGIQASHRNLRRAQGFRIQGLHPDVQSRKIQRGRMVRPIQAGGCAVHSSRSRAPRRFPDVQKRSFPLERIRNGTAQGYRRRAFRIRTPSRYC